MVALSLAILGLARIGLDHTWAGQGFDISAGLGQGFDIMAALGWAIPGLARI